MASIELQQQPKLLYTCAQLQVVMHGSYALVENRLQQHHLTQYWSANTLSILPCV